MQKEGGELLIALTQLGPITLQIECNACLARRVLCTKTIDVGSFIHPSLSYPCKGIVDCLLTLFFLLTPFYVKLTTLPDTLSGRVSKFTFALLCQNIETESPSSNIFRRYAPKQGCGCVCVYV